MDGTSGQELESAGPVHAYVEAPDEFLCPISLELMSTPVVLQQTSKHYDLASLRAWIKSGGKIDPLSGVELVSPVRLRLDSSLQAHIHAFAAVHGIKLQHLELRYGKVTADLLQQRHSRLLSMTKLRKVAKALMHRSEFYPRLQLT